MLYLSGNSDNVIYTEVSANKTLSNPTYLMSLTHAQTGKRWTFIPQNVSSYSGAPYNDRYDIFKFNISGGTQDLTGGTRAWYWQWSPYDTNGQDDRYLGSNKVYLRQIPISETLMIVQFEVDWSTDDRFETGVKPDGINFYINDIEWTGNTNTQDKAGVDNGQIQTVQIAIGAAFPATFQQEYKFSYEFTGTGGTVWSGSYYVPTIVEVEREQPWSLYGDSNLNNYTNITLPPTHINTPVINIDEIGEFTYSIREQSNPINLDPSLSMEQLEVGLAYITEGFTDTFYDNSESSTVYNPD